jgi:hypothetical protein
VYRLNDAYTFRETLRLKESIHRIKDPPEDVKIPLVLVGSKSLPPFGESRSRRIFGWSWTDVESVRSPQRHAREAAAKEIERYDGMPREEETERRNSWMPGAGMMARSERRRRRSHEESEQGKKGE